MNNQRGEIILFLIITLMLIAAGIGLAVFGPCDPLVQHCIGNK